MEQATYMKGQLREYEAKISFGLNFEDNKNSVKVNTGEFVSFDGENAVFLKNNTEYMGRAPSLKSAIRSGWLEPTDGEAADVGEPSVQSPRKKEYDAKKGGSFEGFIEKENKSEVIAENDLVVKNLEGKKTQKAPTGEKLEVAGDQVAVKENLVVGSSTATARTKPHSTDVSQSDHYGADSSTPLKSKQTNQQQAQPQQKKKTFKVDDTTPRLSEDATKDEVSRATGTTIDADETQEATIVRRIRDKGQGQTTTAEGVTLKKTESPREMTMNTQVGRSPEMDTEAAKRAEERAAQRKAQAARSQETVGTDDSEESKEKSSKSKGKKKTAKKKASSKKTAKKSSKSSKKTAKKTSTPKPKEVPTLEDGSKDYLSMLPDDWAPMHWVKKEKFIMALEDVDFIKFILRVETVNAVQNACKKRLKELEAPTPSKG